MLFRLIPVLLLALSAGCAGGMRPPEEGAGAPAPAAAVERFLRLARDKAYVQLGWIFGTPQGPVIQQWPRPEVEKRMYAIASVLEHDSHVVGAGSPVPGRIGNAVRFNVRLTRAGGSYDVPFIAVRGPGERWFVEQVAVESITNRRR